MALTPQQILKALPTIERKVNDQHDTYRKSQAYEGLRARCRLIDDAIDLNFKDNEAFISEIAPPVVRKDYYETSAFLVKYFQQNDIVNLKSVGGTPQANAKNLKYILNANYSMTRYRENCLLRAFDNIARYGTAVIFSRFDDNYRGIGMQTIHTPNGASPYSRVQATGSHAIINESIHPLNYFCNPDANYFGRKQYEGFIDQWMFSELLGLQDSNLYFADKIADVIERGKKGMPEQYWYGGVDTDSLKDFSRATVNPLRMYTRLNFEGNESDDCIYYVEVIGGKVIRCHEVDLDMGYIPLQTGVYIPRPDTWWGNSSVDLKIPFQNLKNWLINTQVESVIKQNDRMILVRRGGPINVADINNRHHNSGIVFYNGSDSDDPAKMMYPVQFQNAARQDLDWLNREINQMIQENSASVNLQNKYNEGGMNNKTLGAAQMQAGLGETLLGFSMGNVANMIERVAEVNAIMMTQNYGDTLHLRESEYQGQLQIEKKDILGEYVFRAESSMMINDQQERIDKANAINQIKNWQGTQDPVFLAINTEQFRDDWIRAWVGSDADLARYIKVSPTPQGIPAQQGAQPQQPAAQPIPQGD